jgi:UDP-N-acetylglucosamine 2-epimerase
VVLGTRPEIAKKSLIVRELQRTGEEFELVHTGQHYSYDMDKVFFRDLKLPELALDLEVGLGSYGTQTGIILKGLGKRFLERRPDNVLVQGDTNTVLAAALVLTDSEGVQEECCTLDVPGVTLRDITDRSEVVRVGANIIVGTNPAKVLNGARYMLSAERNWSCPLGEQGAGARIVRICREFRRTKA